MSIFHIEPQPVASNDFKPDKRIHDFSRVIKTSKELGGVSKKRKVEKIKPLIKK